MEDYYILGDVARLLGIKAHRIVYAVTSGHLPEPALRVGHKRVFTAEDLERIARHFHVVPRWKKHQEEHADKRNDVVEVRGLVLKEPFTVESSGTASPEVRDGNGAVFCWASDRGKALVIAGLLESASGK